MMKKLIFIFPMLYLCQAIPSLATEIDSFTPRTLHLKDATAAVGKLLRQELQACINEANNSPGDIDHLYNTCHEMLGGTGWSKFENKLTATKEIDSHWLPRSESVYKHIGFLEGFAIYFANLGRVYRFGELYIGSDKFGHITEEGYWFYKKAFVDNEGIDAALSWGEMTERTYFGLMTTGVYSYGDLNADLIGMMFYKNLAPNPYNANENIETYVTKDEYGKWMLNPKRFLSIKTLISASLDEGINCSTFKNEAYESKVFTAIAELEKKSSKKLQCPVTPLHCKSLVQNLKFPELKNRLISPKCLEAAVQN